MKHTCRIILMLFAVLIGIPGSMAASLADNYSCSGLGAFTKTVAKDGTGDYTTIQGAIDDSKSFPYQKITILVKNGVYHEKVKVYEWNPDIELKGESRENTIIEYNDYFNAINKGINSTFHTPTLLVEGDGFIAENLTIKNTAGEVGQAIALAVHADNVIIKNCNILGNQDTLYITGSGFKSYFSGCFIEGTTDFIFGGGTAWFESCTIHSLKDSYITAASTPKGQPFGFIFNNCTLTAAGGANAVYMGRPWRIFARTVFMNCLLGSHILPQGWHNWDKADAENNAFYAEYNNSGEGYKPNQRVGWSHQMKAKEAANYTLENVLGKEFAQNIRRLAGVK